MHTVTISSSALRAAIPFQATKDLRFYLCRVHVEPAPQGGIYVVATDGHALIALHDEHGTTTAPCTFTAPKSLLPTIRKTNNAVEITGAGEENGPAKMTVGGASDACVLDTVARFPEWRRVFAPVLDAETEPLKIDPSILARFGDVAANYHASPKRGTGVILRSMQGLDGKRVDFDNKAEIPGVGVVMPYRAEIDAVLAGRVQL